MHIDIIYLDVENKAKQLQSFNLFHFGINFTTHFMLLKTDLRRFESLLMLLNSLHSVSLLIVVLTNQ